MTSALALLDNPMWNCLSGPHARYAVGTGSVRRYAPGFSPIIGFENPAVADLSLLTPDARAGEQFYCEQWPGPVPAGWRVISEAHMLRMVECGKGAVDDALGNAIPLNASHAPAAVALATLTRPGPFARRTLELGDYLGIVSNGELIAMAGERMQVGPWREISGVCCAPGHEGKGLAAALMRILLSRQRARGERTFLHVMSANARGLALYRHLGFEVYCDTTIRVVEKL
jgi:ribosomal protein S18 acetylase RimI-like enzyme